MEKTWHKKSKAIVSTTDAIETFDGSEYFFEQIYFHWKRRLDAGKSLSVGGVCSYFCEVDKANDGSSIEKFKETYKGGRITDIKKTWSGKWEIWIHIPRKGMLCEK